MQRPYISMLMMISIDGKIDGSFIDEHNAALGDYYERLKLEISDAWGNGSVTHKRYFSDESVDLSAFAGAKGDFSDFVIKSERPYAVSFDTKGVVKWADGTLIYPQSVENQVIVITTHLAKPEYLAYLRDKKVAYVFAGEDKIDLNIALNKLYSIFGVRRFAITGGAIINAEFLRLDLVDEIALLIAPFIDGSDAATICKSPISLTKAFKFSQMRQLDDDGVLLIYKRA